VTKTKGIRISELARRAGVTPRTIRFYVQEGLLPEPERTHKNMAYYHPDCVAKIKAIKKAQSARYLPLEVIRRILEQNNFDYAALAETPKAPTASRSRAMAMPKLPKRFLDEMTRRKWIKSEKSKSGPKYGPADLCLINLMDRLHKQGLDRDELFRPFETIQNLIEQAVDLESQTLVGWVLKNPSLDFNEVFKLEGAAVSEFINRVRENHLQKIIQQHKTALDNAYLASADEGFALPPEAIQDDLNMLETRLKDTPHDVRTLVDLATGHSCLGDLETSRDYIRQAFKVAPDDPEILVRWAWFNRFSAQSGEAVRLKKQLYDLTNAHPHYALGHAFLAIWHAFDVWGSDEHNHLLNSMNRCLRELEAAKKGNLRDVHEWMLNQYIKGRILTWPLFVDFHEQGLAAFEKILARQTDLDNYYARRMPFFSKWLWPNLYYFLGMSYLSAGKFGQAQKTLEQCTTFKMLPPYGDRVNNALSAAKKGGKDAKRTKGEP
jgi:DNA-binding transcriptional MerR regulator